MTDQTGTLWVILMTPKKNLLARISSLKRFGKLKIEEMKVMYGKKSMGGWVFQILGQPSSRTFSFHDGDVIRKIENGYSPTRRHGLHVYFIFFGLICVWLCANTIVKFAQVPPQQSISEPIASPTVSPIVKKVEKTEAPVMTDVKVPNPQAHEMFLEAKKEFQYGRMNASLKILQKNMMNFDEVDGKQASAMISEMFFLQCEKFRKESDERKAVISCEKAVKFSNNEKANLFLSAQEEKAKKLYLEGYTMQKFDPAGAKKRYALVLQSAKSKSTWRGKAQYQLRKLKG